MSVLAVQAYIIITSYTADYTNEDIHKRIVLHSVSRSMQMTVYKTFFFSTSIEAGEFNLSIMYEPITNKSQ